MRDASTSSKSKQPKVTNNGSDPVSHFENEITTSDNHQSLLEALRSKVFSRDSISLDDEGSAAVLGRFQADLLKVMSMSHHIEGKLSSSVDEVKRQRDLAEGLKRELSIEKARASSANSTIAAHDKEIARLHQKISQLEHVACDLRVQALKMEKDNESLQVQNNTLKNEVDLVTGGVAVITRWEVYQEWKNDQTHLWDLREAEAAYLHVKSVQERLKKMTPSVPKGSCPHTEDSAGPILESAAIECDDLVTAP